MQTEDVLDLKPGDRIHHGIFGHGTVSAHKHGALGGSIAIQFDDHGLKELACYFTASKLTKMDTK